MLKESVMLHLYNRLVRSGKQRQCQWILHLTCEVSNVTISGVGKVFVRADLTD